MTSDVKENKHSTINIWAICDLSPNLTMTILGNVVCLSYRLHLPLGLHEGILQMTSVTLIL